MSRLAWCRRKKGGIKLVEPNDNLAREYLGNAEESMKVMNSICSTQSNMWLAATKYYIEYFAVYAVMMKLGIKCEIHECTIEVARLLEKKGLFKPGTAKMLEDDKGLRIDNQYYLKNRPVQADFEKMSDFLVSIKETLDSIQPEAVEDFRELFVSKIPKKGSAAPAAYDNTGKNNTQKGAK